MSESTHVQVRFTRRWREYTAGDVAVFPIDTARSLHAQRVAEGIVGLRAAPRPMPAPEAIQQPTPRGGPAQVVRK